MKVAIWTTQHAFSVVEQHSDFQLALSFPWCLNTAEKVLRLSRIDFRLSFGIWEIKFSIQPFLPVWCQYFSVFSSWLLGFWLCCSVCVLVFFFPLQFCKFFFPFCSHGNIITERDTGMFSCWLGEVCAVLSQKMVCHGEHTYLFAQSMMSILAQEEQGGSAVRRIAQEVQRYAHEKWVPALGSGRWSSPHLWALMAVAHSWSSFTSKRRNFSCSRAVLEVVEQQKKLSVLYQRDLKLEKLIFLLVFFFFDLKFLSIKKYLFLFFY